MSPGTRVVVGLSGGVDSAVAALLLKRAGYDVSGLFMKNWDEDDRDGRCAAEEDLREVRCVCDVLGIPFSTVNFATEYWDEVFTSFLSELRAGRTPNPDVLCNREIKFKAFLEHAQALGAHRIATGHYAGIAAGDGLQLTKARDPGKDQSYFLHTLGQHELEQVLFPLADLTKTQVRTIARAAGLPNHARPDSTGICFIGERNFRQFVARYLEPRPGSIVSVDGGIVGHHDGLMFYTLGQRHGLGIGGPGNAWYVAGKDMPHNVLYVAQGADHPALYAPALDAGPVHWVSGHPPPLPFACRAKTRYRQPDQDCVIHGLPGGGVHVEFAAAQRAITPGQSVVFYTGEVCLGGAVISAAAPRAAALRTPMLPQQVGSY